MTGPEWAQVGSAAFTAVAATAAWATVAQVARERRAAERPSLHIEIIEKMPSGAIEVVLLNTGGAAHKVNFAVVENGVAAIGHPPPTSYMARGEMRRLTTDLPGGTPESHAIGVVSGLDMASRHVHAAAVGGETGRWRLRHRWFGKPLSDRWVFRQLYPDAPDPIDLPLATYALAERTRP